MTDKYILDISGEPLVCNDLMTWARWFQTADRKLATETIGDSTISTVFLGLDHGFGGKPLLWETMVFGGKLDGEQHRCETRAEATRMHKRMVERVRSKQ